MDTPNAAGGFEPAGRSTPFPSLSRPGWRPALEAVLALAAATGAAIALDHHVSLTVLTMVYLVAVVQVAYRGSRTTSGVTALLAVLLLNFLFVPPRGTLSVERAEHLLTLAALLGVALLVSTLSARLRHLAEQALRRERRARHLQRLVETLAALEDEPRIAGAGLQALRESFGPGVTLALLDDAGGLRPVDPDPAAAPWTEGNELRDALWHCTQAGQALGRGTSRWGALAAHYLPLFAAGRCLGAVAVPLAQAAPSADMDHLRALADLIAGALERARHAARAARSGSEAEAQKLRNALLASVSHDFRTPLASIVGAASSLLQQRDRLTESDQVRLLTLIEDEAHHLSQMTDNTLQWARLSTAAPALRLDWESVEEIAGSALTRLRRRDPERRVRAQIPPGLPLVRADAVLLSQLLDNLLDNALKYSAQAVLLRASAWGEEVRIDVLDLGDGLDPDELPHLFDTFYRGPRARGLRGAGLGLAVGKAIAEAHGGTLTARRRRVGGTRFRLALPLHPPPAMPDDGDGAEVPG